MKQTPKKVYILKEGKYEAIPYEKFCSAIRADSAYRGKRFLFLHGILLEVTEEDYAAYYKDKRRQKYIDERARKYGAFSYDALTTDEFNGEDILVDPKHDTAEEAELRIMTDKLRKAILKLSEEERSLIKEHFFEEKSQVELSRRYGVNQSNISRRIARILLKLKKLLEN